MISSRVKLATLLALVGICASGIAMGNANYKKLKQVADKIVSKMPSTWQVLRENIGVLPQWHYENLKYEGPRGLYLYLVGDQNVNWDWKDRDDVWHKEPLLKEAIALWIMPPEYRQSWKRFFVFKGHVPAEKIYSGKRAKIYGDETIYWPSDTSNRFEEIRPHISTYGGAPEHTVLSWTTWMNDIKTALEDGE